MPDRFYLNHGIFLHLIGELHDNIAWDFKSKPICYVYAVPRGGIPVAYALLAYNPGYRIVDIAKGADIIIDDIIDSGSTWKNYTNKYPTIPFFALINDTIRGKYQQLSTWIVFPWESENTEEGVSSVADNITRLLQYIGEDVTRGGLVETPQRVVKAWQHWTKGYRENPAEILKVFEDGGENYDQMVTVKDIPFYSHCEHHLAPFFGTCTISYIPNGRIVGLSKLSRVVDIFARRLQVQERLTNQIADCLNENLNPLGVGVSINARHMCMESRGIGQQGHSTITTALKGKLLECDVARREFLDQIK